MAKRPLIGLLQNPSGFGHVLADPAGELLHRGEAALAAQPGHELQAHTPSVQIGRGIQQKTFHSHVPAPEGGLAPHIGHGLMPGFVQTHAGGVDAFGGQQGFRRQQVGRGKTQAAATPLAVHHFAGKAVAAPQQARGLPAWP